MDAERPVSWSPLTFFYVSCLIPTSFLWLRFLPSFESLPNPAFTLAPLLDFPFTAGAANWNLTELQAQMEN